MDRAKAAIGEILHRSGHHDTTVHEKIAPAVVNETVKKVQTEEIQTVVDREVHQDHYHTTIQPVKAREVLPEKHMAQVVQPQERVIDRSNDASVRQRLEQEQAQFHDQRTVAGTVQTQSVQPTIVGEHFHHHVHETIQPIVQKEVIQPSVVHTTVPIHEVHRNEPKIHSVSSLPAVSLSEFERHGGTLAGREERTDHFEGDPKPVAAALGSPVTGSSGLTGSHTSPLTGSHHTSPVTGSHTSPSNAHYGTDGKIGTHNQNTTQGAHHNSALLNKLDPRVDSNMDGKPGFMK